MTQFVPGLILSEIYYWEAVRPIMLEYFPKQEHSAALIGWGSDVLGYDSEVSQDHLWGPRLVLFLAEKDFSRKSKYVHRALREKLPPVIRGYSTHFGKPDDADGGTRKRETKTEGPIDHLIEITSITKYWHRELQTNPLKTFSILNWLTFQEQRLLTLTAGKVFHDGLGLEDIRQQFAYYPEQIWYYLLASQWALIAQEEAFVGRASQIEDPLGSQLIIARLVERMMHLCFLMEKKYAPYSKWLGTAFKSLKCYKKMNPLFEKILKTNNFIEKDKWLSEAFTKLAQMHNNLNITPKLAVNTKTYSAWHALREGIDELPLNDPRNTRPFQVIFAGRFTEAIMKQVTDRDLLNIQAPYGSVSQFLVESSDAMQSVSFCKSLRQNIKSY
ncbi:MAG: DUF4037 domain-containing protein [Anaerolineaceae bacterium]|nr:DUF4037 domain-containing protein [Anaerolineaceae bacterium]